MTSSSLLAAVQSAFGSAASLGYNSSAAAHDIYEGYILTLFLSAAARQGWTFEPRDSLGRSTRRIVFRRGPGRLASGNYTHIHLSKQDKQDLEAHIGVKVTGKAPYRAALRMRKVSSANLLHEFDILVLAAANADICRQQSTDPDYTGVIAHAEAKFYGGDLPLTLGRAMVGLAADCDLANKSVLVTNRNGSTVEDLIKHYKVEFRFLVTPAGKGEHHLISLFESFL